MSFGKEEFALTRQFTYKIADLFEQFHMCEIHLTRIFLTLVAI